MRHGFYYSYTSIGSALAHSNRRRLRRSSQKMVGRCASTLSYLTVLSLSLHFSTANTFGPFGGLDASPFARNHVCQPIPQSLKLCRNMEYGQMRLPNLLGHETMDEIHQQARSWVPLLKKKCHQDLQLLLCSLFAPVCVDNSPVPIYPCRSLCEGVKSTCEPAMQKVGYPWPPMLNCSKFPQNDMCVAPQCKSDCSTPQPSTVESTNHTTEHNIVDNTSPGDVVCPPCDHQLDPETVMDLFCGVEFALKVKIRGTKPARKDLKLTADKRRRVIYKQGSLRRKDLRRLSLLIRQGRSCSCPALEEKPGKGKKKKKKDYYLVMGGKVGRKVFVSAIFRWPKRNKVLRKLSSKFTESSCT